LSQGANQRTLWVLPMANGVRLRRIGAMQGQSSATVHPPKGHAAARRATIELMALLPEDTTRLTGHGQRADRRRLLAMWDGGYREFLLPAQGSLDLGRSLMSNLRIDHPSVSRRHLVWHADPLSVEDCGSSNGTRLNGVPVASGARVPIQMGDTVEVGKVLLL